jgi:hypothetical protein
VTPGKHNNIQWRHPGNLKMAMAKNPLHANTGFQLTFYEKLGHF